MARKRMLDPGIWTDGGFIRMSHVARLLWIGLISNADDDGRGPADPRTLRAKVFPGDSMSDDDLTAARDDVAKHMRVQFYACGEEQYYQLERWQEHQYIKAAKKSTIPAPNGTPPLPQDSANDTPPLAPNEIEREEKKGKADAAAFETLWSAYPRKVERLKARKAWDTVRKRGASAEQLLTAATNYARHVVAERTEAKFVKHPATFLGPAEPWRDWLEPHKDKVETTVGAKARGWTCPHCKALNTHSGDMCMTCRGSRSEGGAT